MPRVPRDVSHDDLVKFLRKRGWVAWEGGRHTILSKDGAQVSVPRHSRLKTGTVSKVLKEAGVTVEDAAHEL